MNALQRWPLTWADLQQSSSLPADRLQNFRQNVRLLLVPNQFQIPGAVGIVENNGPEAVAFQHQEFDFAERHTVGQRAMPGTTLLIFPSELNVSPSESRAEMNPGSCCWR